MRIIDADELMEHVWRDKLDSRELIAKMIDNAPTVKEISTKIPINVFEQLISQEPKTGRWIRELIRNEKGGCIGAKMICSECGNDNKHDEYMNCCPNCGAKMEVSE